MASVEASGMRTTLPDVDHSLLFSHPILLHCVTFVFAQYHKALEAFEKGLSLEPDSSELKEERMRTMAAINTGEADPERAKQAMQDPEIQAILRDPTINKVLQDLQQNPQAGQAALKDKDIRAKIEKLIAAGVLATK